MPKVYNSGANYKTYWDTEDICEKRNNLLLNEQGQKYQTFQVFWCLTNHISFYMSVIINTIVCRDIINLKKSVSSQLTWHCSVFFNSSLSPLALEFYRVHLFFLEGFLLLSDYEQVKVMSGNLQLRSSRVPLNNEPLTQVSILFFTPASTMYFYFIIQCGKWFIN